MSSPWPRAGRSSRPPRSPAVRRRVRLPAGKPDARDARPHRVVRRFEAPWPARPPRWRSQSAKVRSSTTLKARKTGPGRAKVAVVVRAQAGVTPPARSGSRSARRAAPWSAPRQGDGPGRGRGRVAPGDGQRIAIPAPSGVQSPNWPAARTSEPAYLSDGPLPALSCRKNLLPTWSRSVAPAVSIVVVGPLGEPPPPPGVVSSVGCVERKMVSDTVALPLAIWPAVRP